MTAPCSCVFDARQLQSKKGAARSESEALMRKF
ncbi:hypothetical protein NK6_532 [Bradyrhizobium diazoefficiens]|uniref:Uncharacterized protein n=1 Tax=Bradyrhizobium diazoefficiens TaxID=1355477 RepID=A0A0E4BK08_9BRAD|nr:hypothetical protein NK6_532 [Bradyrhizobium diazoefficiens]